MLVSSSACRLSSNCSRFVSRFSLTFLSISQRRRRHSLHIFHLTTPRPSPSPLSPVLFQAVGDLRCSWPNRAPGTHAVIGGVISSPWRPHQLARDLGCCGSRGVAADADEDELRASLMGRRGLGYDEDECGRVYTMDAAGRLRKLPPRCLEPATQRRRFNHGFRLYRGWFHSVSRHRRVQLCDTSLLVLPSSNDSFHVAWQQLQLRVCSAESSRKEKAGKPATIVGKQVSKTTSHSNYFLKITTLWCSFWKFLEYLLITKEL